MENGRVKPTYQIKDWDRFFETNESRKVVNARWVPMPNKQDGKGYRRVAQHKNGVAIFCAWTLMLEVASKMPDRGVLADHDGPLDAEDLAVKTGFPARIFQQAFEFLVDSRVGWMAIQTSDNTELAPSADTAACPPDNSAPPRVEGNGIEQKEREGQDKAQAPDSPPFVSDDFLSALADFEQHRREIRHKLTPKARQAMYEDFMKWGELKSIEAIRLAIRNQWRGVFYPKDGNGNGTYTQNNELRRSDAAERNAERLNGNIELIQELRRNAG